MPHPTPRQPNAFTLSELLIALSLLGVLAAFTIPQILASGDRVERNAALRKAYTLLSNILYDGIRSGDLQDSNMKTFFVNRVKAPIKCLANYVPGAEDCYIDLGDATPGAGFVLPGGITVVDFDTDAACAAGSDACGDDVIIDWNGTAGPNLEGQDYMVVGYSFGTDDWNGISPGDIQPRGTAASTTLFNAAIYNR